jgi:hypothetical protein
MALRGRGVDAQVARVGVYRFGVTVRLGDGREALWDADGTAGIEAQVLRDGVLVGFVPVIEGSADFEDAQVVDVIARTDYDQPTGDQPTGDQLSPRRPAGQLRTAASGRTGHSRRLLRAFSHH